MIVGQEDQEANTRPRFMISRYGRSSSTSNPHDSPGTETFVNGPSQTESVQSVFIVEMKPIKSSVRRGLCMSSVQTVLVYMANMLVKILKIGMLIGFLILIDKVLPGRFPFYGTVLSPWP